jgi:hypothetical protein
MALRKNLIMSIYLFYAVAGESGTALAEVLIDF